ncbi:ArsR/SmtB family transcription factor [Maritalea porphyrae]|uniref:ArsR/SmtB family transcription factor n=2 Tax=Maritalea TaxID=623276 RepID=UPI0022AF6AE2|nr:winged helix-turn-helix domain-containing protein [Maritalea porphyrae]MCZ4271584.1 winged helix-turn-helix domain-containing protein [Maritalea porphyrae]
MKDGPDISRIGQLIGDPARANILSALMSGKALTATELAQEAGVTLQTTSGHLAKLADGGLIRMRKQGRHRYYALTDDEVAGVLENLMHLAAMKGHLRTRTGPRDPALRHARICYDHLAGDKGIALYDALIQQGHLQETGDELSLTRSGESFVEEFGISLEEIQSNRRPLCRQCLDWSERRNHLAGTLGKAILDQMLERNWAKREVNSRIIQFSREGERQFTALLAKQN